MNVNVQLLPKNILLKIVRFSGEEFLVSSDVRNDLCARRVMPNLYVIAGGNGAGKTTIAKALPNYFNCNEFVNADIMAEEMAQALQLLPAK